jgi:hypothetical protein
MLQSPSLFFLSSFNLKDKTVIQLHPRFQTPDLAGSSVQQFLYLVAEERLDEATDMAMDILPLGYSQAVWLVKAVRKAPTSKASWDHLDDRAVRQAYCRLLTPKESTITAADIIAKRKPADYSLLLQVALSVQSNYMTALTKMVIHDFASAPMTTAVLRDVTLEIELTTHGVDGMIVKLLTGDGVCSSRYPQIVRRIIETLERRNNHLYRKVVNMTYDYRHKEF